MDFYLFCKFCGFSGSFTVVKDGIITSVRAKIIKIKLPFLNSFLYNIHIIMKKKTKRHTFAFSDEIDALLRRISKETDINQSIIVERGIQLFAEKKGIVV